jgi:hypothetical protein
MDRSREVEECAEILGKVTKRKVHIYAYADNHYAGSATARVGRWESHSVVVDYRLVIELLAQFIVLRTKIKSSCRAVLFVPSRCSRAARRGGRAATRGSR